MRRTVVRSVAALLAVSTNRWPKAYARSTVSSHPFRVSSPSYEHSSMAWLPLQRSGPPPQQQQQQGVLASKVANNALYRSSGVVSAAALRGGGGAGAVTGSLQVSRGGQQQRATAASTGGVRRSVKICTLFMLSFSCSVGFNVNNKRASLLVPLPWTYAALNLLIGAAVSLAAWFVKAAPWPRISRQDIAVLVPMGLLHAVSHLTVVLGLGAGAVSFLQTVKASEACFTALLSFLFLGQTLPLPVYLTLLPVVVGVGITSCNQIKFSWLALLSALVSNLTNALRNVLIVRNIGPAAAGNRRKASPSSALGAAIRNHPITSAWNGAAALVNTRAGSAKVSESGLANLAPGDTYRLLTVVGAVLLFPAAAYFERGSWPSLWQGATDATAALLGRGAPGLAESSAAGEGVGGGVSTLAEAAAAASRGDWAEAFQRAIVSGVCFNLFYDLTFRLLGQLHPVTHAVGNTVKRIVVIAAGAFAFGGDLGGTRSALGSALAVAGVLGYSVAKARCKPITTTRRSA